MCLPSLTYCNICGFFPPFLKNSFSAVHLYFLKIITVYNLCCTSDNLSQTINLRTIYVLNLLTYSWWKWNKSKRIDFELNLQSFYSLKKEVFCSINVPWPDHRISVFVMTCDRYKWQQYQNRILYNCDICIIKKWVYCRRTINIYK